MPSMRWKYCKYSRGATAGRTRDEEGVVRVARRVLLRLEQRVKIPEAARALEHSEPHCASTQWRLPSERNCAKA